MMGLVSLKKETPGNLFSVCVSPYLYHLPHTKRSGESHSKEAAIHKLEKDLSAEPDHAGARS